MLKIAIPSALKAPDSRSFLGLCTLGPQQSPDPPAAVLEPVNSVLLL